MDTRLKSATSFTVAILVLMSLVQPNIVIVHSATGYGNIDLFTQKAPYNGVGQNVSSDAFAVGEEVKIYALVTYNEQAVSGLLVAFEFSGPENPFNNITFSRTAFTNDSGIATVDFRVSQYNETTFGEWTVIGNVRIGDSVFQDLITFRVGWIVEIVTLKTINVEYEEQAVFPRANPMGIELTVRNIAMTAKTTTLAVTIYDSLDVLVNATQLNDFVVPPNEIPVYAYFFLYIPETTHLGQATVYASACTAPPELGGVPYCPEVSKSFLITGAQYFLTVKTEPSDVVTILGEGWYEENANVNLTAPMSAPASNGVRYRFTHWDIDGVSRDVDVNSINVLMDTDHTATAHYTLQYYLTVRTSPSGIAAVSGEGWYDKFANVTVSAPEVSNYVFQHWDSDGVPRSSGVDSITVYMDAPHTITAYYSQIIAYTLTVVASTGGTTDPTPGTYTCLADSTVQVTALPNSNYMFNHWELNGADVGSTNPLTIVMDRDQMIKAVFSSAIAGWFVPELLYWLLLPFLLSVMLLLALLFYRRKKKKRAAASFYSGWTAWYYCYDPRSKK